MKKSSETQTAHTSAAELPTSASDLMVAIENGDAAEAIARVQTLSERDFIRVWLAAQTLETALTKYALSWQGAEYWGNGTPFPDADEKKAEVELARQGAHEVASNAYTETYKRTLKAEMAERRKAA